MLILQMRSDEVDQPMKKIAEKDEVLKKYIKIENVKREESKIETKNKVFHLLNTTCIVLACTTYY